MSQVDWQGRKVEALGVKFRGVREEWNEYELEDGSQIRAKLVMTDIMRLEDEYDNEGNPVYICKSTNVVNVKSPDDLKGK